MPEVELFCSRRDKDQTLSAMLKDRLGLPWARIKKIVEGRHVKIGGQVEANPARRVRPGLRVVIASGVLDDQTISKIKVAIPKPPLPKGKKEAKKPDPKKPVEKKKQPAMIESVRQINPLRFEEEPDLVYVDDDIVVVNKPAGLTTMRHAEEAEEFGDGKRFLPKTLADMLPQLLGIPGKPVYAVHRIDRDTSGLVIFARSQQAAKKLIDQFRKHTAERQYIALVRGIAKNGRVDSMFVRDRGDGRRGSVVEQSPLDQDQKRAVTYIKLIEKLGENFSVVECRLETGRTHQVRIHLGESGFPLCGEKVYDRPLHGQPYPDNTNAKRPMLHAATLGIVHPITNEKMIWDAQLPGDFTALWTTLRANPQSA